MRWDYTLEQLVRESLGEEPGPTQRKLREGEVSLGDLILAAGAHA